MKIIQIVIVTESYAIININQKFIINGFSSWLANNPIHIV